MSFRISQSPGRPRGTLYMWGCLAALLVVLPHGWVSAWSWERDLRWFYLLLIAFFLSTLLAPVSIRLAVRWRVLDLPNPRKVHTAATPRLGGLAVFGAVLLTLARNFQWTRELSGLLAGGTLIYLLGVWEDAKGLPAAARLAGQLAAALLVVACGVNVTFMPDALGGRWLDTLFTAVWLVGITNAFNFLDGIDGLAATLGTVCALLFLAIAWPARQGPVAYACAALAGGCLGFLPYNWRPARLFLGDAGATFIGFILAGLGVMGGWSDFNPVVALSTPVLILAVPIFDTTYTTVSRIKNGLIHGVHDWLVYAGKDHFHHRLMNLGMTPPEAVGFVAMVNLALGMSAVVCHFAPRRIVPLLMLAQAFVLFMIIVALMLKGRGLTSSDGSKR